MPVKKVPGGYMIVPRRTDPGGRRKSRSFANEDVSQVMQGGDGGPGGGMQQMPGHGGGDVNGHIDPGSPVGDTDVSPPESLDVHPDGTGIKPGTLVQGHGEKDKDKDNDKDSSARSITGKESAFKQMSSPKVSSGKASVTTTTARAAASRPPSRPPSRPAPGRKP